MTPELKRVGLIAAACVLLGAVFGVLIGVLVESLWLWIGVMAALGLGLGLWLSYGFLPES
jgi:hypothetical protein